MAAVERNLQKHDAGLASVASALEDWLTGRAELAAIRKTLSTVKTDLARPTGLPKPVAVKLTTAEAGLMSAVTRFTAEQAPDVDGQRALFESLNRFTRDRSVALLDWRQTNVAELSRANNDKTRARYLSWEAGWLPLWRAEVDITYRLQKTFLAPVKTKEAAAGVSFVRELLGVQARASRLPAPTELQGLHDLATRRLTLLARTAEQLDRLGRGESRGALTRVRRLNREQADLGRQLQEQRLAVLSRLAGAK